MDVTGNRKQQKRDAMRRYTAKNRVKLAAKQRAYYAVNTEREVSKARNRRAANPALFSERRTNKRKADGNIIRSQERLSYGRNQQTRVKSAAVYRAKIPRKIRTARMRKLNYGVTLSAYLEMWSLQGGRCPICGDHLHEGDGSRQTHLDHNHRTGEVRGILCVDCNVGLGRFYDNPAALRAAADYVER